MDVISISKKKYENLKQIDVNDVNTEGTLFIFSHLGKQKILKKLYQKEGIQLASKMFTIEVLNNYKDILPSSFVVPEKLVTVDKNVIGFSMPYIDGVTLKSFLANKENKVEDKIKYLKEVGNIVEKIGKIRKNTDLRHLYLNDIHESNFIIDNKTKKLKVVDLDSCKINNTFCFPSRYLTKNALLNNVSKYNIDNYKHGSYVMANNDSDIYCYIIMILKYLFGDNINNIDINTYYDYLNYLEFVGINKDLIDCFRKIVSHGENINPKSYLDTLNLEQVSRAKVLAYNNVNKRKIY